MNITPLTIYLWQLADSLRSGFVGMGVAATIPTIVFCLWAAISDKKFSEDDKEYDERVARQRKDALPWILKLASLSIVFWSAVIFSPTSKTVAMMVIIPEIANSKVIQSDVPELYNAAVEALKQQLNGEKK